MMIELLRAEHRSVKDVEHCLSALEEYCLPARDLRGVFATAYLHITREIVRNVGLNGFVDAEWTKQYLICFGNLYRAALLDYEMGRHERVPKAWRIAFDAARDGDGLIIQHLMLGINAHINHDLPLALVTAGIDPSRPDKYSDHNTVNLVLEGATDGLKKSVADAYAPILHRLDRYAGTLDDEITNFSIPKAREQAWRYAVALSAAGTDEARAVLTKIIDDQSAVLARLILASPVRHPILHRIIGAAKRADGFLRRLGIGRSR